MPYTTKFEARDYMNTHNMTLINKVVDVFHSVLGPGMDSDRVLLEEIGHWLDQRDWSDATGYYIKIRVHPMFMREKTFDEARTIIGKFLGLFPGRSSTHYEGHADLEAGKSVTVIVHTSTYSIGD